MSSLLKISEACSLGLHAMIVLVWKQDKLLSIKEIASVLDVSAHHLSKVLQRLSKAGLVNSVKGIGGGFKLAQPAEQISFMQIYEAIDGSFAPDNCLLGRLYCRKNTPCNVGSFITDLNQKIEKFFLETKLNQFT